MGVAALLLAVAFDAGRDGARRSPAALEGRPPRARGVAAPGARGRGGAGRADRGRARRVRGRPARRPPRAPRRARAPAARRVGEGQRRAHPRDRAWSSRASTSTGARAAISGATPRASTSRRPARSSGTAASSARSSASTFARRTARGWRATSIRGIPGKEPGEKGSGIHVWNTDGFTPRAQRDARRAGRVLHPVLAARDRPRQRRARPALRPPLHVLGRQRLRGQRVRGLAPPAPCSCTRSRIEFRRNRFLHNRGFASVGLLFKACDDTLAEDNLHRRQRARDLPRGLVPQRLPPQRRGRVGRRHRALRLVRRGSLRGERVRREPHARSTSSAGAPTRASTETTGPTTTSRISTATAAAIGRTSSGACSTTCAGTSPRPTCSRGASPPPRSRPRSGASRSSSRSRRSTTPRSSGLRPCPRVPEAPRQSGGPSAAGLGGSAAAVALGLAVLALGGRAPRAGGRP